MRVSNLIYFAVVLGTVTPTIAAAENAIYPLQVGDESLRYFQGTPTLDLASVSGAVQITPLNFDHGSMSFRIAVYNKSGQPANFDGSNIRVTVGAQSLAVLTKDQLIKKAKSRAMWSQIGIAMLAGVAVAAASQAYTTQTYQSYTNTPWGSISHVAQWRDNSAGTVGALAAGAAGSAAIVGVQNRLDYTIRNLSSEVIQTTTIDPDSSYGGRLVIEKVKDLKLPQDVHLTIAWNGVDYRFAFRVTKPGQDLPPPFTPHAIAGNWIEPSSSLAQSQSPVGAAAVISTVAPPLAPKPVSAFLPAAPH